MNYSLKQIYDALDGLCVLDGDKASVLSEMDEARACIKTALSDMDKLVICGRDAVDCLLGCMMALESIIGKDELSNG